MLVRHINIRSSVWHRSEYEEGHADNIRCIWRDGGKVCVCGVNAAHGTVR